MSIHSPVLSQEVVEILTQGDDNSRTSTHVLSRSLWYLDGTLGGCGHAVLVAHALHGKVRIVGLDRDERAIARAEKTLRGVSEELILETEDFRNLDIILDRHGISTVDRIAFDLGISSDELEDSGKGFSFMRDEPLLMTMGNPDQYPFTARDIVNTWKEEDIANVIYAYGEDRYARRIARAIVQFREKGRIDTSRVLADIVRSATPRRRGSSGIDPATRTFQALRIAVNDELKALAEGLSKGYARLSVGGRMAVISFHSLEDRIVKDFFRTMHRAHGDRISKKPIRPTHEEISHNPRSRSARLRYIEKA